MNYSLQVMIWLYRHDAPLELRGLRNDITFYRRDAPLELWGLCYDITFYRRDAPLEPVMLRREQTGQQ
jgi:hypothetical protein